MHLAYKAPLQKWQARTAEDKNVLKETKLKIQKSFKEEMGLLVDMPKVGYGNSKDANTSRRFYDNPECSSRITGINIDLIKRFKIILEVTSSVYDIDPAEFDDFAHTTAKLRETVWLASHVTYSSQDSDAWRSSNIKSHCTYRTAIRGGC